MNIEDFDDDQIEWLRAQLIDRGHSGALGGGRNPNYHPAYWSAEEIVEFFQEAYPNEKIPSWSS